LSWPPSEAAIQKCEHFHSQAGWPGQARPRQKRGKSISSHAPSREWQSGAIGLHPAGDWRRQLTRCFGVIFHCRNRLNCFF